MKRSDQKREIFLWKKSNRGFSVIEVMLGVALFALFSSGVVALLLQGLDMDRLAEEEAIASKYASEGLEALRSLKNQSFGLLSMTPSAGIDRVGAGGMWAVSGASTSYGKYVRTVSIASVSRDGSGNIVASGGTLDPLSRKVISTVTWPVSGARTNTISFTSYLTDWKKPLLLRRGMLVYGDGGTTTDAIRYRLLDGELGTWSAPALVADVDGGSTNRVAYVLSVFSSPTRNEKVLLSRHMSGSAQYIYGQVWNGSSWGNVVLLASWNGTTLPNVQNFDGTYLSNGDFLAVFSDNSRTPVSRIWNGSSWSGNVALQRLLGNNGNIPTFITLRARPGTSEAMAAFLDQRSDTQTEYFNGGAYTSASWTNVVRHASSSPTIDTRHVDFAWSSSDALRGAIVYPSGSTDRRNTIKIFTADGAGGGSWSGAANAPQSGILGSTDVAGSPLSALFLSCNNDSTNTIDCFRADTMPTWLTPINNTLTTTGDAGIVRSFHTAFEQVSGDAISVYSDTTSIPKLKRYDAALDTYDASPISLGTLTAPTKGVRLVPLAGSEDVFIVMGDANRRVATQGWDGSSPVSSGALGPVIHGSGGALVSSLWFDFAWDGM